MIDSMSVQRDNSRCLLTFARRMRRTSPDAETKLWRMSRGRELAGFKFRRQHPIGGYILDFYCVREKVCVEADGGQHIEAAAAEYDRVRTARLNKMGIRVVRFSDIDVLEHPQVCAEEILRVLEERRPSPQPSPGVPGEGEKAAARITPSPGIPEEAAKAVAPLTPSPGTPGEGRGEGL